MKPILCTFFSLFLIRMGLAVRCGDINFNDGKLKLNSCSEQPWKQIWVVEAFEGNPEMRPRDEETTHYISMNKETWLDVCGETEEYETDENSYIEVGYFLKKKDDTGAGTLSIDLYLNNELTTQKLDADFVNEWRNFNIPIKKKGIARVEISLGSNQAVLTGVDFIKIYNSKSDDEECKPAEKTTTPTTINTEPTTITTKKPTTMTTRETITITTEEPTTMTTREATTITTKQPTTITIEEPTIIITEQPTTTTTWGPPPTTKATTTVTIEKSTIMTTKETTSENTEEPSTTMTTTKATTSKPSITTTKPVNPMDNPQTTINIIAAIAIATALFVSITSFAIIRKYKLNLNLGHVFNEPSTQLPRLAVIRDPYHFDRPSISGVIPYFGHLYEKNLKDQRSSSS